mmetsp:Transcript_78322/g.221473  ORF Transcript_78322/g.221473 Transcript_78322/m.221473 type:complete len:684 (+) Transcript_78322:104-2155(+)
MKVLVLGGTQFMGRLTVEALLNAGHEVVLLNRGRTANPFAGHANLRCVRCDRMDDREGFREALRNQGTSDAVIDFIGFQEVYMQDTLQALTADSADGSGGGKRFLTRHYVFISTDSVYWAQRVPVSDSRLAEGDAEDFSPEEFDKHLEHCNLTSLGEYQLRYGGNKLGCERVLEEAWRTDGFPVTTLRLPDVYGPNDNLGGFWELVAAIEMRRPVPVLLQPGRIRSCPGKDLGDPMARRFSWAYAEDVRDAILATVAKGDAVHGATMHVAHEEALDLRETCAMIAEAMGLEPTAARFDDRRNASLPSTDYGTLDVSQALRLLRPWRPTPMRAAVKRSVSWFLSSKENRRYHRLVHREARLFDDSMTRRYTCGQTREVPYIWVGSTEKAARVRDGPVVLCDSLPSFTGQAVLGFMQRLMDQAGEVQVSCELQRGAEVEEQTWTLRHFAGHLLPQSVHTAAQFLEAPDVLAKTDLLLQLQSPLVDIREDEAGDGPPPRVLRLGGAGARKQLRRAPPVAAGSGGSGLWDCALLGRRKWRLFPPDTPPAALCASGAGGPNTSPADCFAGGPDATSVQMQHTAFAPVSCWECEQTMGDAVVVPDGWWYQTYDDDRTLSISARYGAVLAGIEGGGVPELPPRSASEVSRAIAQAQQTSSMASAKVPAVVSMAAAADDDGPEVIEFELVD